jgi:hypothetical protein
VESILAKYGWLSEDEVKTEGCAALLLVLKHSNFNVREKYLPMMKKAVEDKKLPAIEFAVFQDQLALEQGKKQVYGTQLKCIFTPSMSLDYCFVKPIEDARHVDVRRASIGLPSMAEDLKKHQMTWDVEAHIKAQKE